MDMKVFEQWESDIRGYCRAYPTVFTKAEGVRQIDENGNSYIDFFSGAGVMNFGHNNEAMKKAVINYIQDNGITHSLDMYTTAKRDFINAFVDTILKPRNWNYKLQFMGPTGTNAVEAALKLARRATGRNTVIAFGHGFHGMTLGALACTANDYFRNAAGVALENVQRYPLHMDLEQMAAIFNDPSSGVKAPAAFIIEPVQAEGGVNVVDQAWLKGLRKIAKDHGSLFIVDDIQAACGRTGSFFSFDEMDLDPDIITLAKGIGGFGTPIAMNLNKPEYDKFWSPGEHTGTFRGQNISFVAGREALRYFENDDLMTEVKEKAKYIRTIIDELAKKYNLKTRGKGMMQALDIDDGPSSKAIAMECFNTGLLIGPCGTEGKVIKLIPPLIISQQDLEEGMAIFSKAVDKVLGGQK